MNFVVLTAALSSANANLYIMSRTLFSLSRAGFVPASFGVVTGHGAPLNAMLVSSVGLGAAVLVRALWPDSAYVWFFGVALFGALFVWLMIFVTHIAFRARRDSVDVPCVGAALRGRDPDLHLVGARSRIDAGRRRALAAAARDRLSPVAGERPRLMTWRL